MSGWENIAARMIQCRPTWLHDDYMACLWLFKFPHVLIFNGGRLFWRRFYCKTISSLILLILGAQGDWHSDLFRVFSENTTRNDFYIKATSGDLNSKSGFEYK